MLYFSQMKEVESQITEIFFFCDLKGQQLPTLWGQGEKLKTKTIKSYPALADKLSQRWKILWITGSCTCKSSKVLIIRSLVFQWLQSFFTRWPGAPTGWVDMSEKHIYMQNWHQVRPGEAAQVSHRVTRCRLDKLCYAAGTNCQPKSHCWEMAAYPQK